MIHYPTAAEAELVYTPRSPLADPGRLLRAQWADLKRSRELAIRLIMRNLSARYRQTLLGYFWAVFPMLATAAIWLLLLERNVIVVEAPLGSYPLFLLTGLMLWQTFVDAVQAPLRVVGESKSMLARVNFPREALMFAALGEVLFNLAIRVVILLIGWIYLGGGQLPSTLWLSPLGVGAIIMFGMTVGILIVPIGLLYNDVTQGLALVFQVWLLATPVLYPAPEGWSHTWVGWVNPVSPLLTVSRDWMLTGSSEQVDIFIVISIATCLVVLFGMVLYRIAMPVVIERLQS